MIPSRKSVLGFLDRFKEKAAQSGLHLQPRKKNLDSLAQLGFRIEDAEEIVNGLTDDDYVGGPESDDDGSEGEVWIFGASSGHAMIYIKLKLDPYQAKCLSFHEAEHRLVFPLGGRR